MELLLLFKSVTLTASAIVGGASMIVKGIGKITKITPSKKDDIAITGLEIGIQRLQGLLDYVALNPNRKDARK